MITENIRQGDRVLNLLRIEYPSYHPLIAVAKIAHDTDDKRLEFDCHKILCEYIEPKLKSIEVIQSTPDDAELRVVFEDAVEGEFEEIVEDGTSAPALEKLPVDELLAEETSLELDAKVA